MLEPYRISMFSAATMKFNSVLLAYEIFLFILEVANLA